MPVIDKKLTLKVLTCKVVTLTALMDVRNTVCSKEEVIFRFGDKMKQSRPGFHLGELIVKAYAPIRRLCLCTALLEYFSRTSRIRQSNNLFVTFNKPHKSASQSTIARWIKLTLTFLHHPPLEVLHLVLPGELTLLSFICEVLHKWCLMLGLHIATMRYECHSWHIRNTHNET